MLLFSTIALVETKRHAAAPVFFLMAQIVGAVRAAGDRSLLEGAARGEGKALRKLFDAHAPHALALARRILRSPAEAEEVVQETFVEVWKRAAEYDASRGTPQAWILTIARTRAIDRLRSRDSAARTANAAAAEPETERVPLPLELVAQRQAREQINAALDALPSEQRAALELAYFEGLSHREIAERTATPLGTVKTRVRLAMEKLASLLGERSEAVP